MWSLMCTKEVWIIEYSAHVQMFATYRRTSCLLVNRALWGQILTWQENHWETIGKQRWQLARMYMGPDMTRVLKLAGWTDGSCNVRRHASVRIAFTILTGGLMDWMIRNYVWNWDSHDKHDQYSTHAGKEWHLGEHRWGLAQPKPSIPNEKRTQSFRVRPYACLLCNNRSWLAWNSYFKQERVR